VASSAYISLRVHWKVDFRQGIPLSAGIRIRTAITERYPEYHPELFTNPATMPPRAVQLQRNTQLTVFKFTRSLQVLYGSGFSEQSTGYLNMHLNSGSAI
jgi:hypothetical protein